MIVITTPKETRDPRVSLTLMLISNVKRVFRFVSRKYFHSVKKRETRVLRQRGEKKEIREKEKKETLIIFEGVGIGEAQIGRTIFRGDTTGLN